MHLDKRCISHLLKTCFQVASVRRVVLLSRLIFVAMILSMVNLSLIAFFQRAMISWFGWTSWLIDLPHLGTHIRWLASEIRICRSLVFPWDVIDIGLGPVCSGLLLSGREMLPAPSIVPIVISSHSDGSWGQSSRARVHIRWRAVELHSRRICCIDSVTPQMSNFPLSAWTGIFLHLSPIIYASCIDLNRNCCTRSRRAGFLRSFQIVASVSLVPLIRSTALFAAFRFAITSRCRGL